MGFYRLGAVFCFAGLYCRLVFYRTSKHWNTGKVEHKYILLGGVIGAFITITVIQSMSALGPAKAAMLIVVAQLAVAYLIELMGLFGVDKVEFQWRKLIGMAMAIGGIILFKWEK